jgi:outer membrane lipoprotein-sorting protein
VPGDQQATKTSMRKLDDLQSPLAFLLGKANLEKELQGLSIAQPSLSINPSDVVLVGTPKALAERISRVQLEITPAKQISRILIESQDGSTTEYRFSEQSENVLIDEDSFHFVPPPGVEVIEGDVGQ